MKKKLSMIAFILSLLVGITMLSYPFISNWLYERDAIYVMQQYDNTLADKEKEEIEKEWEKAKAYNNSLSGDVIEDPFIPGSGSVLPEEYTSAKLFTDLDKLDIGDIFDIHVLERILRYQVDQVLVVEPSNTRDLLPAKSEDYVTLVTCTPYGVNTHRLLIRGTRIPYEPKAGDRDTFDGGRVWWLIGILTCVTMAGTVLGIIKYRKKRSGQ